ncbi:DNA modification methylase [Thermoanaerobacterium sp. RBIITD]|uniref:DNA modification methylase n=1 Tax=Thermoanaerobacterium sp. RBIITD TaxID=1550240 RepID=UPI000BBFA6E9|nr:DNA modification methylase [Thermoanaerobacterium sp. RBIITD]SNX54167.1 ParB-like nuclease domain-containing protein [Thermoanaerobacterium sp. RBIITD]
MELIILDEIKKQLFPLQKEEMELLEESILKEGIREPLIVWNNNDKQILVDGHNRYEIAQKHNLSFTTITKDFADIDEAIDWINRNQLGRRNLTDEQRKYLIGKLYNQQKEKHGGNRGNQYTGKNSEMAKYQIDTLPNTENTKKETATKISKAIKYAPITIKRCGDFAEAVEKVREISPVAAQKILQGEVKDAVTALPQIAKKEPEKLPEVVKKIEQGSQKVKDAVKEINKQEEIKKAEVVTLPPAAIDIRHGDFRNVLKNIEQVDAIITDPPYPKEFLPLWEDLGKFAAEKLKEGGYLVAYTGQFHLPEVFALLSKYLDYVWTFCLYHEGQTQIVNGVNVICRWKPVLIFQKGKTKFTKTIQDYIISEAREKDGHDWQQSMSGVKKFIELFTDVNDTVCDPFTGSGTTPKACKQLKRKFVGAEIDEETYKIAIGRVGS